MGIEGVGTGAGGAFTTQDVASNSLANESKMNNATINSSNISTDSFIRQLYAQAALGTIENAKTTGRKASQG